MKTFKLFSGEAGAQLDLKDSSRFVLSSNPWRHPSNPRNVLLSIIRIHLHRQALWAEANLPMWPLRILALPFTGNVFCWGQPAGHDQAHMEPRSLCCVLGKQRRPRQVPRRRAAEPRLPGPPASPTSSVCPTIVEQTARRWEGITFLKEQWKALEMVQAQR